ncbi:MAG TPA: M28 family peptidase [Geminicoccaceae bacterium]|nr:M28 family peptidase [Geminicoccaceae bacterium]
MDDVTHAVLGEIGLDEPWGLVEAFARQPREKPDDANRGADLIVQRLRRHGIPVTVHQPEIYLSLPIRAEVRAGGRVFHAKPPAFAASRPAGVTAPLLYLPAAGGGTPLDRNPQAAGAEAVGKVVIIEGFALPNFVAGLEAAGAVAVIAVNPGERIHWGTVSTIWGTPEPEDLARLPKIPSAAVNQADGRALIALAAEGAEATVATELETGWFMQKLPVVEIEGAVEPDEFVLLHGHYDSWREGVGDNGTGNACMLEVARVVWAKRDRLRRSVRLAWWPGHSTGRYGGSAWFADTFALDLAEHCVVHMNCDSPGCRWATSYRSISATAECEGAVKAIVRAATGQDAAGKRPQRNSDYTFNNIGISACFSASSMMPPEALAEHGYYVVGGCGGNIAWHTEDDTLEIADRDVLKKDIELYATAILHFANADLVPIDWRATAREFAATIERYQEAAGGSFDLEPSRRALAALSTALDGFYGAIEAGRIPAGAANAAIRDLARILIPINFTRGPRFQHDPALNVPQLPTIEPALRLQQHDGATIGFARAQLVRGQNRLIAALREATRRIEQVAA